MSHTARCLPENLPAAAAVDRSFEHPVDQRAYDIIRVRRSASMAEAYREVARALYDGGANATDRLRA